MAKCVPFILLGGALYGELDSVLACLHVWRAFGNWRRFEQLLAIVAGTALEVPIV
jgi:hypothetical protein